VSRDLSTRAANLLHTFQTTSISAQTDPRNAASMVAHALPSPHSAHLRRGRPTTGGGFYLLTTMTSDRRRCFADWEAASEMCRAISSSLVWRSSALLCWVLMPDHWHGLVELGESDALASLMGRFKASTARRYNASVGERRVIWGHGYHDRGLRDESDLIRVARYVVMNPVRAGLVTKVGDYPYWDAIWVCGERSRLTPLPPSTSNAIPSGMRSPAADPNPSPSHPPACAPT
jgi:putative transposase